jgi:Lipocalin-like domain
MDTLREDNMRRLISAVVLVLLGALIGPAIAEDVSSSIAGLWKLTSFSRNEVGTGKATKPYGERPGGYIVYTRGGHFVSVIVDEDRKAPAAPNPSDAERAELFKSLAATSGTYKVEGSKVVAHYDASWIQSWTGTERTLTVEINGNKLTSTSPRFKSTLDGQEIFTIATYERVE